MDEGRRRFWLHLADVMRQETSARAALMCLLKNEGIEPVTLLHISSRTYTVHANEHSHSSLFRRESPLAGEWDDQARPCMQRETHPLSVLPLIFIDFFPIMSESFVRTDVVLHAIRAGKCWSGAVEGLSNPHLPFSVVRWWGKSCPSIEWDGMNTGGSPITWLMHLDIFVFD